MTVPADRAAGIFYNDLGLKESEHWTALIRPHSVA